MCDDCPAERAAKTDPKEERALGDEFRGLGCSHGRALRTAGRMRLSPRCPGAEGQGERREDRPDDVHRAPRTVSSDECPRWPVPVHSAAVANVQETLTMGERIAGKKADA